MSHSHVLLIRGFPGRLCFDQRALLELCLGTREKVHQEKTLTRTKPFLNRGEGRLQRVNLSIHLKLILNRLLIDEPFLPSSGTFQRVPCTDHSLRIERPFN